jgi:hypothetical protein
MKFFKLKTLSSLLLTTGVMFAGNASAALTGAQTAVVDWQGMAAATYGDANENNTGAFTGGCPDNNCFMQDANAGDGVQNIVVGVVGDPTDSQAHFHRQGATADRESQYHPDSTGEYFRMQDLSSFSLKSLYVNVTNSPETGGNFALYGYANALNPGLLTLGGAVQVPAPPPATGMVPGGGGYGSSSDPEGGTVTPIASYLVPNDGVFDGTISLATLTAADADWGNIGAFWLTYQGFNHSPTENYTQPAIGVAYPDTFADWDVRLDDIVLGAPVAAVPVPGAIWLFGSAMLGLIGYGRKKAAV